MQKPCQGQLSRPSWRRFDPQNSGEMGLLDVWAGEEVLAPSGEADATVFQDVATMAELKGAEHVLFDQEDGEPAMVDSPKVLEDRPDDDRGQAETGLVQHEEPRTGHQATSNRAHLLLAPRQRPRELALALPQTWKELEHPVERLSPPLASLDGPGADLEVLPDGHGRKKLPTFRHVGDATSHNLGGGEAAESLSSELDGSGPEWKEAGDCPEGGRLARPVASDQGDHLALVHLERGLVDGRHVAVAHLEAVKPEQDGHTLPRGRPRSPGDRRRSRAACRRRSSPRRTARRCDARATSPRACCAR